MEYRVLGLAGRSATARHRSPLGGAKQRALARALVAQCEPGRLARAVDRRVVGRPTHRRRPCTTVQVYVSRLRKLLAGEALRHTTAGLPAGGRPGARSTCGASSGSSLWVREARTGVAVRSWQRRGTSRAALGACGAAPRWPSSRAEPFARRSRPDGSTTSAIAALEERIEADLVAGSLTRTWSASYGNAGRRANPHRERLREPVDACALPIGAAGGGARGVPQKRAAALDELGIEPSDRVAPPGSERSSAHDAVARRSRRQLLPERRSGFPAPLGAAAGGRRSSAASGSWRGYARSSSASRKSTPGGSPCSPGPREPERRDSCGSSRGGRRSAEWSFCTAAPMRRLLHIGRSSRHSRSWRASPTPKGSTSTWARSAACSHA